MVPNPKRRRSPRVAVQDHDVLPVIVRDISLGGFSLELAEELPEDSVHDFDLRLGTGTRIVLRARVAHTTREPQLMGPDVFVTGLEFLADVTDAALQKSA